MAVITHWLLDQVMDDHVKRSSDTLWTKVDTGINVLSLLEQTPLQLSLSFALCPMFVSSMEQFTSTWLILSYSEKS
jgi:hypothetical protein